MWRLIFTRFKRFRHEIVVETIWLHNRYINNILVYEIEEIMRRYQRKWPLFLVSELWKPPNSAGTRPSDGGKSENPEGGGGNEQFKVIWRRTHYHFARAEKLPKWHFWTCAWNLKSFLTKSILLINYENGNKKKYP